MLLLTPSEVAATDGVLCWKSKRSRHRGPACSRERLHDGPCRYDIGVKPGPWTLHTWLCCSLGSLLGTGVSATATWLILR